MHITGMRERIHMISNDNFKELLQKNKELIDSITPKNPTISKEDEWATDPFYDQWSQEEHQKQREELKRDFREYCERREKEEKVIGFRTLDWDEESVSIGTLGWNTDNFS